MRLEERLIRRYIRSILREGGNARVRDIRTGEDASYRGRAAMSDQIYFLDRPDSDVVLDRQMFISDFQEFFTYLSDQFEEEMGIHLWPERSLDDLIGSSSGAFSGSSRVMFDADYDDNYVLNVLKKSRMGDIDIMVPEDRKVPLWNFLSGKEAHAGAPQGQALSIVLGQRTIVYVGQNDGAVKGKNWKKTKEMIPRKSPKGDQINCIFAYTQENQPMRFVQVDFEFVPYAEDSGMPSDLAVLGHYSSEEDMEVNVKGAYRSKLLQSVVRISTFLEAPIYSTSTRVIPREEVKPGRGVPTRLARKEELDDDPYVIHKGTRKSMPSTGAAEFTFSGDKGMRRRIFKLGVKAFGDEAYRELATPDESRYEQSLPHIFERIFNNQPEQGDISDLHSFNGLIRLIKKYIPEKAHDILMGLPGHTRATGFVQELFGPAAQNQYANDDTSDEEYKTAALSIYLEAFPSFLTLKFEADIETMKDNYYEAQRRKRERSV